MSLTQKYSFRGNIVAYRLSICISTCALGLIRCGLSPGTVDRLICLDKSAFLYTNGTERTKILVLPRKQQHIMLFVVDVLKYK